MSLKSFLRDRILFPLIDLLPFSLKNKLKMVGTCCFGEGWGYLLVASWTESFENISESDVRILYDDISEQSLRCLLNHLMWKKMSFSLICSHNIQENDVVIIPVKKIFPGLNEKRHFEEKVCRKLGAETCFKTITTESGCYHHGLTLVGSEISAYIKNKVFMDLGAYNGDSSFVLSKYQPEKILAIEPSLTNCELCRKNMKKFRIDNVEIIQVGVADEGGVMRVSDNGICTQLGVDGGYEVEVVTVDGFLQQHAYGKIGLIKADLEGMGLKMVKGAVETIKRDRPVLLLAIYHNKDEFMGIYEFLKKNVPDYHYRVEALSGLSEVTLIAWPEEACK